VHGALASLFVHEWSPSAPRIPTQLLRDLAAAVQARVKLGGTGSVPAFVPCAMAPLRAVLERWSAARVTTA
jgi:hypothetical protein